MHIRTRGWKLSLLPLAALSAVLSLTVVSLDRLSAAGLTGKSAVLPTPKFSKDVVDLFFDDARQQVGSGQPGGAVPTQGNSGGGPAPASDGGSGAAPVGNWSAIISGENLEQEVKALMPVAEEAVKSLAGFKSKGREHAQTVFTELATIFAVIAQFDGEVKWKKDALGWRNKAAQVANNCKTSSDAAYKGAQVSTNDLKSMLSGQGVDIPKADAEFDWGKEVYRPGLMKRMETARAERLGAWTSDKGAFTKNKDALMREAQLLAMFAKVMQEKTFESGDDETYIKYAVDLQKQCMELVDAVKTDNQPNAQSALSRISKSCDTCHGEFR